jgi:cold shock CspA family protein
MNGTITTYLPQKLYGFIKGDDKKDYFFHRSDFSNVSDHEHIFDGSVVSFEQTATPKGYKAVKCVLVNVPNGSTFVIPDRVVTSKSHTVKGWDLVEVADWMIVSDVRKDLDAAKNDILEKAEQIGAMALIELEYSKSTQSSGNYYYSVHGFRGRPATVARRHADGTHSESTLKGLNERLELANDKCEKINKGNQTNVFWLLVVTVAMAAAMLSIHGVLSFLVLGGSLFIASRMRAKTWLYRSSVNQAEVGDADKSSR